MFKTFNYRQKLRETAQLLGLSHDGERRLYGTHKGIDVGVRIYTVSSGSGSNRSTSYYTEIHAMHRGPLRMGLSIERKGLLGFDFGGRSGVEIAIGHQAFDARFLVKAFDAERAYHFLRDERLVDTIMRTSTSRWTDSGLNVTDVSTSITLRSWQTDVSGLLPHLDAVHRVTWEVNRRRAQIPDSPAEREAATALRAFGRQHRLDLDEVNLMLRGPVQDHYVEIVAHYGADGNWSTRFDVRFPQSLNLGLRLQQDGHGFFSKVGEFFGSQDIVVGHPQLDHAFKIKGQPEHLVAQLLQGEVADRIVGLKAVARSCEVSDVGIQASAFGYLSRTEDLDRCLTTVRDLASAMTRRAFGPMANQGPYR